MALLLKGGQAAAAMNEKTAARVAALTAAGVVPTLAVVRMGAREDDLSYERGVMNRCAKLGIQGEALSAGSRGLPGPASGCAGESTRTAASTDA